jgi:peptide deformylase
MNIVSPPLKIVNYPHPALRHPAKPLTSIDANVHRIAEAMLELMREHKGLGLAAPQVALPFQMFIAHVPDEPNRPGLSGVFLNPEFLDPRGTVEAEEGCLSFPGLYRKVRRARTVHARAYNLKGELVSMELSDLPARVWQHETDHLHARLFIDKLNAIGRLTVRSPLAEFERDYRKAQKKGEIPPDDVIEKQLAELEQAGPPDLSAPPPVM